MKIHATAFLPAMTAALLSGCSSLGGSDATRDTAALVSDGLQTITTQAGHTYLYAPMPESDRSAVAITWHADIADLPVNKESMPRIGIDLMLNGGAGSLAAEEIIADFEDLDAGSDLWVQPQEISGFIVSPKEHMSKASEIANLVVTQPNLEERWFRREKKSFLDDAAEREIKAAGLAWNLFREATLGDHPYKRFWSLQPIEGIESIELDDIKDWHERAFSSKSLTITVAGNAEIESINSSIDKVLIGMPDSQRKPMADFGGAQISDQTILLHKPDVEKSVLLVVGRLPARTEEFDVPVQLGVGVLGWGKQSRLFTAVRTDLRAAYGFGAGVWNMTREQRVLHLSGEVETGKAQDVLNMVRESYEKFRTKGISLIEFPIARKFYVQRVRDEIKEPSSVAYMIMDAKLTGFSDAYFPSLLGRIQAQSRADVNKTIMSTFPEFDSMLKIIVTPDENAIEGACVITAIDQWESCPR
ncbi:MAG: M16 family metallopeptidase [Granulosicoccus sp.]